MTPKPAPGRWRIVGQQWHAVVVELHDDKTCSPYVRTGCGWLIWPSLVDARLRESPVCSGCASRYLNAPTGAGSVPEVVTARGDS